MYDKLTIDSEKTVAASKIEATNDVFSIIYNTLIEIFGDDLITQVGKNEISIGAATYKGSEVCVNLVFKSKEPFDRATAKREIVGYNRIAEGEKYQNRGQE